MHYSLADLLAFEIAGSTIQSYLYILLFVFVLFLVFQIIVSLILGRLEKAAKKTKNDFDDLVIELSKKAKWPVFLGILLLALPQFLNLNDTLKNGSKYLLIIIAVFYVIKAANTLVDYAFQKIQTRKKDTLDVHHFTVIKKGMHVLVWGIGFILVLSNLGFNVNSLVAGLGIGGIAIALALQNILGDVFSSLSIYFDKPFKIGDFIIVGDKKGTVKTIGIKTTRITSLEGEEIVMSNNKLTGADVQNYGKMKKRRISFILGVAYETPQSKLKKIPPMVKKIIKAVKSCEPDRVHFKEFADFSLNYEIVYFFNSGDYKEYMDAQQKINLTIKSAFEKEKIEFAYPTSTVYLRPLQKSVT